MAVSEVPVGQLVSSRVELMSFRFRGARRCVKDHRPSKQRMEDGSLVGAPLSPESTVTSLLSSSGHLRSSLRAPEHSTSFRYRNKEYESASAALEAYIADFEKISQNSCPFIGKLVQPDNLLSTPSRTRVGTLRNRDVLKESLTERELDFLDLPVSSLHHASNRDRLSMTTDELLSIPHDGSMPVTHTSAFIQGLLSQSASSRQHCSFSTPGHKICTGLSRSNMSRQNHQHPHLGWGPGSDSGRPGADTTKTLDDICSVSSFKSGRRAAGSEWTEPSSLRFCPDQFTSSKADMEHSGMSDMPDLKYDSNVEAWIQCCDRSKVYKLSDDHASRTKAPSWIAELEDDDSIKTCSQVNSQQTLGDLKLQFAEQILLLVEKKSSDIKDTMLRDNRIESLIQKADQVLNSLSLRCERADSLSGSSETSTSNKQKQSSVRPMDTEELLLTSPSHYPSFTLRDSAAAAAGASTEPQSESRDQVVQNLNCCSHANSMEKQPGPVEALKQMLFRLQAVEVKLQGQQHVASVATADWRQAEETPMEQKTESEVELENYSGGPSLHRALHHLNRLKLLVEEPSEKHREEKDEDERCHSSTSTERLICSQQKPT
ncbi:lung adenoma susceptibility protein 2 isoform X1 [Echeneis naucrates]|nr:lung adenoma susceptibility protein 2 isoform X1 [Echeneis naucrates]